MEYLVLAILMATATKSTPIYFGHTGSADEPNRIGICYYDEPRHIILDKANWTSPLTSPIDRAILVAHERGHCDFNLKHDDRLRKDGCPVSIMSSVVPTDVCYSKHQRDYDLDYLNKVMKAIHAD